MNLLVVSKPFDIDQVMSNKEASEGNCEYMVSS